MDNCKQILISGGGNSLYGFWDTEKKLPLNFYRTKAAITCGKVSPCGKMIAYAVGDNWAMGLHGMQECYQGEKIWVHSNASKDVGA